MYQKSLLPPIPPFTPHNAVDSVLHRPDQDQWPDFPLYIDPLTETTRTFRQYRERISLGSTALASMNLSAENNDMVGIQSENCLDFFTIVHSLLTITTPFALFPSQSTAYELVHLLKLSKATKVFVQRKYLDVARQAAREVGLPDECIFILEGHSDGRKSFDDIICDVQQRKLPRVTCKPAGLNTLAYLVFSSGTTGLPKGVMISHGNIIVTIYQNAIFKQVTDSTSQDETTDAMAPAVVAAILPLYHSYGLQFFAFRGFLAPMTTLVLPKWNIETVLKIVPKYRVNSIPLVPSLVHQLVNHPKFETTDWSSVTGAVCGAAYLPEDLSARFSNRMGVEKVTQGYGLSECTVGATLCPSEPVPGVTIPPGSVGILYSGMESRIVRDDGTDAGINEVGELWLRGGNVTLGYYNNEEATRKSFLPDGWLKTGDMFRTDGKGVLFFEDRAKDTLKVSGSQVSPMEIEAVLWAHPDKVIIDVTVAGVSGGRTSDEKIPRAWIVLSPAGRRLGEAASIKALHAWTQKTLVKYKWLRGGIEVVAEIPKSPTGKVLRRLLQDKYEAEVLKLKAKL